MDIRIRRASAADLDAVAPLFDAYRRFYRQATDPALAREFLAARMHSGESVVLLAERDGAAAGFTQLYPLFSSVSCARMWVLNDLFVTDSARRGGVARALLDAAAGFARENGAIRIVLETSRDNAPARALYRSAGWHEEHAQWYALPLSGG